MKKNIIIGIAAVTLAIVSLKADEIAVTSAAAARAAEASTNGVSADALVTEGYKAVVEQKKAPVRQMFSMLTYNQWTNADQTVSWPSLTNQVQVVRGFLWRQVNSRLNGATNLTQVESLRTWAAGALALPR